MAATMAPTQALHGSTRGMAVPGTNSVPISMVKLGSQHSGITANMFPFPAMGALWPSEPLKALTPMEL